MKLKLTYFGLKARGEVARLILTGGGIPFEDVRVDFCARPAFNKETQRRLERYETPSCTYTAKEWLEMKDTLPLAALPLLEIDGLDQPICQSRAINRHCARLAGVEGDTDEQKLLADMFADCAHEYMEHMFTKHAYMLGTDGGNMKAETRWARWDALPSVMRKDTIEYLTRFEALHKAHFPQPVDYVAGNTLTHADYQLLVVLDFMTFDFGYDQIIEKYAPSLAACVARTKSNPRLTDYLAQNERNVFTAAGFAF